MELAIAGLAGFHLEKARLPLAEEQFLVGGGVLLGTVKHLGMEERNQLAVEAMSTEAVTTSEIEGEILDRASVQSSIQRQLGLAADDRRVGSKEEGTAEMMVDLYRTFSTPLSEEMIFGWYGMLMSGRQDVKNVGCYRTSDEPMQVVQGQSVRRRFISRHPRPRECRSRWRDSLTGSSAHPLEERSHCRRSQGQEPHICILSRSIRLRMATAE